MAICQAHHVKMSLNESWIVFGINHFGSHDIKQIGRAHV